MNKAAVAHPASGGEQDGLPVPRRHWALAAIWIAVTMAVLDSSIANIALPTISAELGASPSSAVWVVNAYQIAIAMLLLSMASLGERVGYRRVYLSGVAVFACAFLGCALAGSLTALAIARFIQGFGSAAIMAMNGALIRHTYPREGLARGIGYNALVVAISSAAGPSVAAGLLAIATWRWLFAVNLPLAIVSIAIGIRALPEARGGATRFDLPSALLNAVTFACVFMIGSDMAHATASLRTAGFAALGTMTGVILVRRGRRDENPLIPLDLIARPALRLSYLSSITAFAAQMIVLVTLPFRFQTGLGLSHVEIGLLITPLAVGTAIAAPIAGRLAGRPSSGPLAGIGMFVVALAFLSIALLPASAGLIPCAVALAIGGMGFGLFQTPNNRIMLTMAPQRRSGAAAGMLATMRIVGQTCGAIVAAAILRIDGTNGALPLFVASTFALVASVFAGARSQVSRMRLED
ncbi:MFS transporter [Sphingomonas oryzagri]|uniref:MFS transporter n=1 Tax=Sphingomonas oryzagri TaxID=3042314 RepID=A0ABT6N1V6_9SPHN|nr:MFS transporter [Sphingomonas oryzagri]MDH7639279.1 MFS transporter [Sphingomonas oryzagri]